MTGPGQQLLRDLGLALRGHQLQHSIVLGDHITDDRCVDQIERVTLRAFQSNVKLVESLPADQPTPVGFGAFQRRWPSRCSPHTAASAPAIRPDARGGYSGSLRPAKCRGLKAGPTDCACSPGHDCAGRRRPNRWGRRIAECAWIIRPTAPLRRPAFARPRAAGLARIHVPRYSGKVERPASSASGQANRPKCIVRAMSCTCPSSRESRRTTSRSHGS